MSAAPPPSRDPVVDRNQILTPTWSRWLSTLSETPCPLYDPFVNSAGYVSSQVWQTWLACGNSYTIPPPPLQDVAVTATMITPGWEHWLAMMALLVP